MPTTSYTTPTVSVNLIGARTDSAGVAVTDVTAEEARIPGVAYTEGYITPSTAWKVAQQTVADMSVKVGSGTAKLDHYCVAGEVAGQGNYICRLDDTTKTVTIDAADASQARTDEIYLVVRDHLYDASSRALPQLGYRKGDLGGANPGVDAAWRASVLLARVAVGAAVTTITTANITDMRTTATLAVPGSAPVALTDAATIATDVSLGKHFRVTLGGNRTLGAPTNPTDGQRVLWEIKQDGTGSRTLAYNAVFRFGTDITAATLTTTASKTDFLGCIYNSTAVKWDVVTFVKGF